ncbi:Hsp20 family protein [Sphingopyxis sp. SE2]|uniref:Hsp20 family protein n=1 Tax=Sphingopyxis sp. SE2 TaxID=1586240 RepID=UPI0028BF70B5|nr:Hsp20 family protein [Sphingopyxis sp. SE2]MDT7527295.1 Hsp20 family protein [Sphingopyxis sp. SE2]
MRITFRDTCKSRAIALIALPPAYSRRIRTTVSKTNIPISPPDYPAGCLNHRNEGSLLDADHPANGVLFARRSTLSRQGEDSYRITLAVAGFRPGDIEVVAQQNQLIISGKRGEDNDEGQYLHRGIAARAFERRFQLADYVEVASADFDNGLLKIDLRRVVPEAMKPRKIEIGGSSPANDRLEAPKKKDLKAA